MAKKVVTVKMEEELVKKLDEVSKTNHRKRGPEINVAVEFYLKYQGVDLDALKDRVNNEYIDSDPQSSKEAKTQQEEKTSSFDAGEYGFND